MGEVEAELKKVFKLEIIMKTSGMLSKKLPYLDIFVHSALKCTTECILKICVNLSKIMRHSHGLVTRHDLD
jgi:hypothetical protein